MSFEFPAPLVEFVVSPFPLILLAIGFRQVAWALMLGSGSNWNTAWEHLDTLSGAAILLFLSSIVVMIFWSDR